MGVSSDLNRVYGFIVNLNDDERINNYVVKNMESQPARDEFEDYREEFFRLFSGENNPLDYDYCGEIQHSETIVVGIGSKYLMEQWHPILAEDATNFPEFSDEKRTLVQDMYDDMGYGLDENGDRAIGWYFVVTTG